MNSDVNPRTTAPQMNNMIPSVRERQGTLDQNARENGDVDLVNENIRLRDKTGMRVLLFIKCFTSAVFVAFYLYIYSPSPLFFSFASFLSQLQLLP